jgi:hypothetical protein
VKDEKDFSTNELLATNASKAFRADK